MPPRIFGHALVVVVCLSVAYASRSSQLAHRYVQTSAAVGGLPAGAISRALGPSTDALVRPSMVATPGAPAQAPRQQVLLYQVQPGDTVPALANRFDISADTILWANDLSADSPLNPGQELNILPVSGVLYTVEPGDTAATIAQRFQSDAAAITQVNQLTDPSQLPVGRPVVVPGGRLEDVARAQPASRSNVRPPVDQQSSGDPIPQLVPTATPASDAVPDVNWVPFRERGAPGAVGLNRPKVPAIKPLAPISYVVTDGDTLSGIAAHFGVSADSIAAANGLGDEDSLSVGQKLLVPPVPGAIYVVQNGDTLEGVAAHYGVSASSIAKANGLSDPFVLQVGRTLIVPNAKVAAPAATPTAVPQTTYTIQSGDSVSSIAAAFGADVTNLINVNGLAAPYILQPGQHLVIPGSDGATHTAAIANSAPAASVPAVKAAVEQPAPAPTPVPAPHRAAVAVAPSRPAAVVAPVSRPASSGSGWGIVAVASRYLGAPYVWGGTSPSGFDCSGFVWYVYQRAGVPISRDMWGQLQSGSRVSRANLQPGDIVFFEDTYQAGLSHDGIYIGGGRFIHAADYGIGVTVGSFSDPYYSSRFFGATRPW